METNEPTKSFKAGGVRASVFDNQRQTHDGRTFTVRDVVIDRTYKDNEGNWKTTNRFSGIDIAKAILVLQKAFEYVSMENHDRANGVRVVEETIGD